MYACLQVDTGFYYSLNTIYVRIPRYQSKFRAVRSLQWVHRGAKTVDPHGRNR